MSSRQASSTKPDSPDTGNGDAVPDSRLWRSKGFQRWLNRRMPPSGSIQLHQGNIFILPTREGLYFTIVMLIMILAAVNYQNSLIFALAFLLVSLFMVGILHTFRNLSGLLIQAGVTRPAFAGEDAEFAVTFSRGGPRTHESLQVGWDPEMLQTVDLVDETEQRARLFVRTGERGRFNPGRMLVQTNYPVGLFRAWSWVDLDMSTLVYPRPVYAGDIPVSFATNREGEAFRQEGADDFYGLRDFRDGDPLRHVAWKSFARNQELQVKEYSAYVDRRVWLDYSTLEGLDRESRLSRLCYWVLQVSRSNDEYGLRLPGIEIPPARGPEHRERVLNELALFEAPA